MIRKVPPGNTGSTKQSIGTAKAKAEKVQYGALTLKPNGPGMGGNLIRGDGPRAGTQARGLGQSPRFINEPLQRKRSLGNRAVGSDDTTNTSKGPTVGTNSNESARKATASSASGAVAEDGEPSQYRVESLESYQFDADQKLRGQVIDFVKTNFPDLDPDESIETLPFERVYLAYDPQNELKGFGIYQPGAYQLSNVYGEGQGDMAIVNKAMADTEALGQPFRVMHTDIDMGYFLRNFPLVPDSASNLPNMIPSSPLRYHPMLIHPVGFTGRSPVQLTKDFLGIVPWNAHSSGRVEPDDFPLASSREIVQKAYEIRIANPTAPPIRIQALLADTLRPYLSNEVGAFTVDAEANEVVPPDRSMTLIGFIESYLDIQ